MKIVINTCYGGFSLSDIAVQNDGKEWVAEVHRTWG